METKVVRPRAKEMQTRFFKAIDTLIESGSIKNLSTFCSDYGLHRPKYSNIRTSLNDSTKPGTGYKFIDIDALNYLSSDFNVSAEWLLQGKGVMFRNQKTQLNFNLQ